MDILANFDSAQTIRHLRTQQNKSEVIECGSPLVSRNISAYRRFRKWVCMRDIRKCVAFLKRFASRFVEARVRATSSTVHHRV